MTADEARALVDRIRAAARRGIEHTNATEFDVDLVVSEYMAVGRHLCGVLVGDFITMFIDGGRVRITASGRALPGELSIHRADPR